jgi:hypothetical protein
MPLSSRSKPARQTSQKGMESGHFCVAINRRLGTGLVMPAGIPILD